MRKGGITEQGKNSGASGSAPESSCPTLRRRVLLIVLGLAILPAVVILLVTTISAQSAIRSFVIESSRDTIFAVSQPLAEAVQADLALLDDLSGDRGLHDLLTTRFEDWQSGAGRITPADDPRIDIVGMLGEKQTAYVMTRKGAVGTLSRQGYAALDEFPYSQAETQFIEVTRNPDVADLIGLEVRDSISGQIEYWFFSRLDGGNDDDDQSPWLAMPLSVQERFENYVKRFADTSPNFILYSSSAGPIVPRKIDNELGEVIAASKERLSQASGYIESPTNRRVAYAHIQLANILAATRSAGRETNLVVLYRIQFDPPMLTLFDNIQRVLWVGILILVGVGVFGIWLSNRLVFPITELRKGFSRLEHGELDFRIAIHTGDEIEELAGSMNQMAEKLQQTYQRLADKLLELDEKARQVTITYEIAKAVNKSLDLKALYRTVIAEMRHLIPSDYIFLGLVNSHDGQIEWASEMPTDLCTGDVEGAMRLDSSLSERSLRTREIQVLRLRHVPDEFREKTLLRGTQASSICIVPLTTSSGPVGVLIIADRKAEAFQHGEVEILERISASLATAIDHSRLYEQKVRFAEVLEEQVCERTEELQRAQDKLVLTEKLAATGELASNLAHEINNPLSIIKNYLRLLRDQMVSYRSNTAGPEMLNEGIAIISEEIDRIARIVDQLKKVHRKAQSPVRRLNINREISQLVQLFRQTFHEKDLTVKFEPSVELQDVVLCEDHLRQILFNLLRNAYDAVGVGGRVGIRIDHETPRPGLFTILIKDNGPGISPDLIGKIFTPFFTTKKDKGSGLGLSVSYGLALNMGGRIEALSPHGGGAEFRVVLPVIQKDAVDDRADSEPSDLVTRQGDRIIIG